MTDFKNPKELDEYIDMVISARGKVIRSDENGIVLQAEVSNGVYVRGETKTGGTYRLFEVKENGRDKIMYESRNCKPTLEDLPLLEKRKS